MRDSRQLPSVAFLISGRGSNMVAIIKKVKEGKLKIKPAIVFSDNPGADGLKSAEKAGIPVSAFPPADFPTREDYENTLVNTLKKHGTEWVVAAGYMRLLKKPVIEAFPGKILNIHPSLLPAFAGLNAQQQTIDAGVKITGCTVHFVDMGMDTGPIVMQTAVPVEETDTVESLSRKILHAEHDTYWRAIKKVVSGYEVRGRTVVIK